MELRSFKYVIAIARCRTISKAAQELYLSQPSLSLFLQNLERRLGVQLFERINKKMYPTYAGEVYIKYAESILHQNELLSLEMQAISQNEKGRLAVGSTPARARYVFPDILSIFKREYPDFIIEVKEASQEELSCLLDEHIIDFAFYTLSQRSDKYVYHHLNREEIVLCASERKNYGAIAKYKEGFLYPWIDVTKLKDETFLMVPETWKSGKTAKELLDNSSMQPTTIDFSIVETAVATVGAGLGICFCPDIMIKRGAFRHALNYFSAGDRPCNFEFVIAQRKDFIITEPLKRFIEISQMILGEK